MRTLSAITARLLPIKTRFLYSSQFTLTVLVTVVRCINPNGRGGYVDLPAPGLCARCNAFVGVHPQRQRLHAEQSERSRAWQVGPRPPPRECQRSVFISPPVTLEREANKKQKENYIQYYKSKWYVYIILDVNGSRDGSRPSRGESWGCRLSL
jgi:hypothetical protein